jgi:hypothetical protein
MGRRTGSSTAPAPHHVTIENNEITNVSSATLLTSNVSGSYKKCPTLDPSPSVKCLNQFDALPVVVMSFRNGVDQNGAADPSESTSNVIIRGNLIRDSHVSSDVNNVGAINILTNVVDLLIEGNQVDNLAPRDPALSPNASIEMTGVQVSGDNFNTKYNRLINDAARPRRVVIRAISSPPRPGPGSM